LSESRILSVYFWVLAGLTLMCIEELAFTLGKTFSQSLQDKMRGTV